MKKLLAAIAVLAPALTIAPAAPASADSVCAPITVDGQQVCQDLTPIEQAIANAEATALGIADTVLLPLDPERRYSGEQIDCVTSAPHDAGNLIAVDVVTVDNEGPTSQWSQYPECAGSEVTVPPVGTTPGPVQRVHVPEVCLTTTDTCVGPVDQDVQIPFEPAPAVCTQPETILYTPYSAQHWYRQYDGPISCTSVSELAP